MYVFTYIDVWYDMYHLYLYIYLYIYICIYTCIQYICVHICTYKCIYISTCIYTYMHTHMYIHTYMCIYLYTYMYIHLYSIYTYISRLMYSVLLKKLTLVKVNRQHALLLKIIFQIKALLLNFWHDCRVNPFSLTLRTCSSGGHQLICTLARLAL